MLDNSGKVENSVMSFLNVRHTLACGNCRARNDLEEERLARIDAEDVVSKLQEQLADVQHAEETARQAAETRLSSLTQEYESMRLKVSACSNSSNNS